MPVSSDPEVKPPSQNSSINTVSHKFQEQLTDAANQWLAKNRSLVLRQTPVWAKSLALIVMSLGSATLIAGFVFKIDEVVSVQGQLQSIGGSIDIKSPVAGKIAEVLFKDGNMVRKGQLLLRFDTREAADQKITLQRILSLEEQSIQSRLKTIQSQKSTVFSRIQVLKRKLATKTIITRELERLVSQGGYQRLQLLEQRDQVLELQSQMAQVKQQADQLDLQADQIELDARKNISQIRSRLNQATLLLQYKSIVAPSDGVVFNPLVRRDGYVNTGDMLLKIVPQTGLFAEVYVPNKDIGFVKSGLSAKVRVDAFPFARYGEIPGRVIQISADALPPDSLKNFYRFPVKVRLNRSYLETQGAKIPLRAGMAVTVNLRLREKRVISLISDLLVDQRESIKSIRQQ